MHKLPYLKIFIANPLNASNGKWLDLPEIEKELLEFLKNKDYVISDIDTNLPISDKLKNINNIFEINDLFEEIEDMYYFDKDSNIKKNFNLIATALSVKYKITDAIKLLKDGNYIYFENVSCEKELGKKIVEMELVNIPQELEDYIDYEKIGTDWKCKNTHIVKDTNSAITIIN